MRDEDDNVIEIWTRHCLLEETGGRQLGMETYLVNS